jgi:hypothetical protein
MATLAERMKAKRAEVNASRGGFQNAVRLPNGKHIVRILPNWENPNDLEADISHDFGEYWIKDPVTDKAIMSLVDSEITFNKPSPLGEALNEAIARAPNDSVRDKLKGMRPRRQVLFNALVRNGEDPEKPIVLSLNWNQAEEIFAMFEDYGNIHDPEKGIDIVIERTGTGFDTKYSVRPLPESKSEPVPAKVMKELNDLSGFVNQITELKEQKALTAIGKVATTLGIGLSVSGALPAAEPAAPAPSTSSTVEGEYMAKDGDASDSLPFEMDSQEPVSAESIASASSTPDEDDDELDALLADLN